MLFSPSGADAVPALHRRAAHGVPGAQVSAVRTAGLRRSAEPRTIREDISVEVYGGKSDAARTMEGILGLRHLRHSTRGVTVPAPASLPEIARQTPKSWLRSVPFFPKAGRPNWSVSRAVSGARQPPAPKSRPVWRSPSTTSGSEERVVRNTERQVVPSIRATVHGQRRGTARKSSVTASGEPAPFGHRNSRLPSGTAPHATPKDGYRTPSEQAFPPTSGACSAGRQPPWGRTSAIRVPRNAGQAPTLPSVCHPGRARRGPAPR